MRVRYLLPQPEIHTAAVVLAAGKGSRLKSPIPKVAHIVAGRPMLHWVLDALAALNLDKIVVVVGHEGDQVRDLVESAQVDNTVCVTQVEQLGTGHAMRCALGLTNGEHPDNDPSLLADAERILLVYGDGPTLSPHTLVELVEGGQGNEATVLTTMLDDPTGYGRIIRNTSGMVTEIVEQRDTNETQASIREINTGIYCFEREPLVKALGQLTTDNSQGEEYITDVVGILAPRVGAVVVAPDEVMGINDQIQLAESAAVLRTRIIRAYQENGVAIIDPATTYIEHGVSIEPGAVIEPGCHLRGTTRIGAARIGPNADLTDTTVEDGATITYSVVTGATIGADATVGPFAHLRPGTVLAPKAKAGGFVETKNATIGEGSKVPHLSYIGDASIGAGSNIGAGTITCNYNGYKKFRTTVGEGTFIGSDSMLIAPVTIGNGAYVGAGSAVATDVPDGALYIERAQPVVKDGWASKFHARYAKPDTDQ
ncbi:bifunctional UDP-N-acetylglucosamine diphosphorylase/glucosamine-1-phosphate N-acetyltransferase GlmU [Stomatohabitans albus]|uniref:bifunctional UDP-N-acetylglucosamine diphosphorylase/glucosamine-1-phosphate N-acetyltransferase GlmU n=1 Tax=Stomatohabitans albus TaxID=3110766 RepID=UPI00300C3ABE